LPPADPRSRAPRKQRRTNAEISEETRTRLLAAGRRAFATHGYADVSTDEIGEAAGLTRGALHYQFHDKRGLFEAVVRALLAELAERIARRTMENAPAETEELERGCDLLLEAYGEPAIQTILLRDAPVVLGWATWHRMQEEAGLAALLRHALDHWAAAGWIAAERVEPIARLLLGALTQAGVAIGEAGDHAAALVRYREELRALVRGLSPEGARGPRRKPGTPRRPRRGSSRR
jgi:AcrR family transcriptional regulator